MNRAEEWVAVAVARGADASAMVEQRSSDVGPIYMAGYAVECSLKAFLQACGIPMPAHGPSGHDLRALWKTARLHLRAIHDLTGYRSFFVSEWSTNLRYELDVTAPGSSAEMVREAQALARWIQNQARRERRR